MLDDGPHYVGVDLYMPGPPRHADPSDDCAGEARPGDPIAWGPPYVLHLLQDLSAWDLGSFAHFTPDCVASPTRACPESKCVPAPAYVAYDVDDATYYLEVGEEPQDASGIGSTTHAFSGKLLVGYRDDCEDCPPPVCC